jgi:DNA-binding HxlR family transcriptional regulator
MAIEALLASTAIAAAKVFIATVIYWLLKIKQATPMATRKTPKIGSPVRGSTTGRPIMVVLDLLGRRAALRIVWELRRGDQLTFRALQDACETNPSLLNTRLKELRGVGLVEHAAGGYLLTPEGRKLMASLQPLCDWAGAWGGQ